MSILRKPLVLCMLLVVYYVLLNGMTTTTTPSTHPSPFEGLAHAEGQSIHSIRDAFHYHHDDRGHRRVLIPQERAADSRSLGNQTNVETAHTPALSDASQWLPTGARMFCTSYDNESYMWLKPEQPFAQEVPLIAVDIEECPAPILFHNILHFPSALKAPILLGRRKMRSYFRKKNATGHDSEEDPFLTKFGGGFSTTTSLTSSRSALFVFDTLLWRSVSELTSTTSDCPIKESSRRDTIETCPAHTRRCVQHCLRSLCCTGIQIINNITHRRCDLIAARLDETRADAPYPLTKKPLYLLAQRREFRPSLNADHLRLVVESGPRSTMRLYSGAQGQEMLGEGATTSIALVGQFGELATPTRREWRTVKLDLVITSSGSGIDVASGWSGQTELSLRQQIQTLMREPDPNTLVMSPSAEQLNIRLSESGKGTVNWNDVMRLIETGKAAGSWWGLHVGKTWCLLISVAEAAEEIEPAVACTLVVRPPKHFEMNFVPLDASGNRKLVTALERSNVTAPPTEVERWVSIDPVTCAPHLRRNECCLPPVGLRLVDAAGVLSAPFPGGSNFQKMMTDSYYAPRVELVLEASADDDAMSKDLLRCVRIVGGSFVFLDNAARGVTRNVVGEVSCDPRDLQKWASSPTNVSVLLRPRLDGAPLGDGLRLSAATWIACQVLHDRNAGSNRIPYAVLTSSDVVRRRNEDNDAPVAFSHRAHGQLAFLQVQLQLIAAFAPNSLMVLHISAQWKVRLREWSALHKFNETAHPRTHINPRRLSVPPSRAAHVHACNFQFLLEAKISFSHVVIWASNELMVRAGIEAYVKQFDMSHPGRVDPRDGVAHDNMNIPLTWASDDEHRIRSHRLWEFMPWDGVSQEPALSATFRRLYGAGINNSTTFPTTPRYPLHQVYLEGAFFSREVAREIVRVVALLRPGTFCTASGQYANNEIFPFLLSKYRCVNEADASSTPLPPYAVGAQCGGRVSAMLWREFFYFGTSVTLQETRCSPFANPFGWKRVKKAMTPLTLELQGIAADPSRQLLTRDLPSHCNLTRQAALEYREMQRRYLLSQL
jgi:hypothetical protein